MTTMIRDYFDKTRAAAFDAYKASPAGKAADAVESFWQKATYDATAAYIDASLAWLAWAYKTPLATPDR